MLGLRRRNILLVDDNALQRMAIRELLKQFNAQVVEANQGSTGLDRLEEDPSIDLIISDLAMPGMDGITFISEIVARGFHPELVLTSSYGSDIINTVKIMAETYGLRVPLIVHKPLTRAKLLPLFQMSSLLEGVSRTHPNFVTIEIESAIRNNEFVAFLQPQVSLTDGSLHGFEALARWYHPKLGVLPPASFIYQVEQDQDLLSALTFQVMASALETFHLVNINTPCSMSLNIGAKSINSPKFSEELYNAVLSRNISPTKITLELTETVSVTDLKAGFANLAKLRIHGFKLAIDDFGTGYASFEALQKIPFTEFKLDKSIIGEIPKSQSAIIVAKHLANMANELDLTTVAEGIETKETYELLQSFGCMYGQGYYIARPMPGPDFLKWLEARTR